MQPGEDWKGDILRCWELWSGVFCAAAIFIFLLAHSLGRREMEEGIEPALSLEGPTLNRQSKSPMLRDWRRPQASIYGFGFLL
jgi:hypothetical protein